MDSATLPPDPRVRILLGKGGVGKTIATSALARMLASRGQRVLLVELDGRPDIARHFGTTEPLSPLGVTLLNSPNGGSVTGRHLAADDALVGYLEAHGLRSVSRRLHRSGLVELISGAIPGLRDVLVLGKVKQLAGSTDYDAIVVDGPATGHALTMLTSPAGLSAVARGGPVRVQADEVAALLGDPQRCSVVLVTTPEELPVTETIEAAYRIEDEAGVALEATIVNRVHPSVGARSASDLADTAGTTLSTEVARELDEALSFLQARARIEAPEIARLRRELPLPVVELPACEGARAETAMVAELAELLDQRWGGSA
jgi:anion-transporting  ArsA/GET3 family ATPase